MSMLYFGVLMPVSLKVTYCTLYKQESYMLVVDHCITIYYFYTSNHYPHTCSLDLVYYVLFRTEFSNLDIYVINVKMSVAYIGMTVNGKLHEQVGL